MKTRLLRKLRKEARDKYRIQVQHVIRNDKRHWCIEEFNGHYWQRVYEAMDKTLDEAKEALLEYREWEFKRIANELITERERKRLQEQVKNL